MTGIALVLGLSVASVHSNDLPDSSTPPPAADTSTPSPVVPPPVVSVTAAPPTDEKPTDTPPPVLSAPVPLVPGRDRADSLQLLPSSASSVIVLGYHQFIAPGVVSTNPYVMQADVFETEMKYLKDNGYEVIPMDDLIRFVKKEISLPRKAVVVTIDDGYESTYTYAYPILKKFGYPWTFFCYSDFVNSSVGAIKWDQLKALQAEGVDIECHTKTHPFLDRKGTRTDEQYAAFIHDELVVSKQVLEDHLGKKITRLAYPYGRFNAQVQQAALEAGYEALFTVANNPVTPDTELTSIGRYIITREEEKNFTSYVRQGSLTIASPDPLMGETIHDPRPTLRATLGYDGQIAVGSISAEIYNVAGAPQYGPLSVQYEPGTRMITCTLPRDLDQHLVLVRVRIEDETTRKPCYGTWHFYFDATATPAPVMKAVPIAP